jgi:hypothetical protein
MNFKIMITERGKVISHKGTSVRTPTEIILNKQETEFIISQLRQLGITQYVCEEYVPEKKMPVQKKQHNNEKIGPIVEELTEESPVTLLRQLAREN